MDLVQKLVDLKIHVLGVKDMAGNFPSILRSMGQF
jgi:pyruvate carboxylase